MIECLGEDCREIHSKNLSLLLKISSKMTPGEDLKDILPEVMQNYGNRFTTPTWNGFYI